MESKLPNGWADTNLGSVFTFIGGGTPDKKNKDYWNGSIPWASVKDIKSTFLRNTQDSISESGLKGSASNLAEKNDLIVITRISPGESAIATRQTAINQDLKVAKLHAGMTPVFAHYLFRSIKHSIREISSGTTVLGIRNTDLKEISFPLPPLNEQKRIVAKIEELFSEIDTGVASFQQARRQLGVYRQALLKKAFTAELTADWRKEHPDQIEPAKQLLERIRQEREARYQQQLDDWKTAVREWEAGGKEGKKHAKPKKPKKLDPIQEATIPGEWVAFPYGELCSIVRNGLSAKPSGNNGYKIARISAVRPMFFDYADYRYLDCSSEHAESYALRTGDLIFTRYNGSRRYVGVCAKYVEKDIRLFPDKLIQTRPDLPSLDSAYLELALNSGCSRAFIETKIRTTAGQSGVSGGDVKLTPVAICSLPEQKEIVRRLEAQFEAIEQNEREIDAALQRAEALRQSILKKAFSGQLVPQDPNDEPASILLERIRAERESAGSKRKSLKNNKKKALK
ncbi:MAG: restriction endonuclease subunit S [Puniceicoccaceae bacterium]|nr:MAG: restriction endonuclease subunit S [Puniceicoccaceae bacterium]